ncbi:hypothetical protein Tco_0988585 [Tanacetum coccineum]|uniref:Uncharacterized protein n=1 Tax=Tanacetum coccineum TaxID=301880 RepID=A0ABQ5ERD2_9ASTR
MKLRNEVAIHMSQLKHSLPYGIQPQMVRGQRPDFGRPLSGGVTRTNTVSDSRIGVAAEKATSQHQRSACKDITMNAYDKSGSKVASLVSIGVLQITIKHLSMRRNLSFHNPDFRACTIGCCEVGGGGGVVGGVGVVCGDGVDRGVGGVDCGVVCGFVCEVVCGFGVCFWCLLRRSRRSQGGPDVDAKGKMIIDTTDKEGIRADVSAPDWSANDWSAPEGTKMLPADQSEADTSAPVSPYHVSLGHILKKSYRNIYSFTDLGSIIG